MILSVNKVVLVGQVTARGPQIARSEKDRVACDFWVELAEQGSEECER